MGPSGEDGLTRKIATRIVWGTVAGIALAFLLAWTGIMIEWNTGVRAIQLVTDTGAGTGRADSGDVEIDTGGSRVPWANVLGASTVKSIYAGLFDTGLEERNASTPAVEDAVPKYPLLRIEDRMKRRPDGEDMWDMQEDGLAGRE